MKWSNESSLLVQIRCLYLPVGSAFLSSKLTLTPVFSPEPDHFILALNDALEEFAKVAPRQARVVELRYFGGLSEEEIVEVTQSSLRTVQRDWQFAKAWLHRALKT